MFINKKSLFKISNIFHEDEEDEVLNVIPTEKIINGYKIQFNIDITSYFKEVKEIYLCKNKKTGYIYFYPLFVNGSSEFYQNLENYEWYYQPKRWEFDEAKKHIKSGILLEIGCGRGDFLNSLRDIHNLKLKGIEHNVNAINYCKSRQLDVGFFKLEELKSNSFDYITSFQVLEHINDVRSFFENSYRLLKPGGKLIIGIPNTKSFVFYPFSENYFQNGTLLLNLPPHHMGWWNKNSIKKTGCLFGFNLLNFKLESIHKQRFELITANIGYLLKNRFIPRIIYKFFKKLFPIFFQGETMLVVFEKSS